jgi:polyisoprenoid-binding protein YceI
MTAIDHQSIKQELPLGTWKLDPVHSSAGFAVKHMVVATFRGRFEDFDATLEVSEDGAVELAGTVDPRSIVVKDENLAAHLQSPDFFDTERYPEIRFGSTSIRIEGDEAVLEGELTIKGDTNPVTARGAYVDPHEDMFGSNRIGLSFETVVDRTQYGLEWNAPLPKGGVALANEVTLIVDLEMVQA